MSRTLCGQVLKERKTLYKEIIEKDAEIDSLISEIEDRQKSLIEDQSRLIELRRQRMDLQLKINEVKD